MERPFMAVTGHYLDKDKKSIVVLLAFRFIEGSHTGANIGEYLFSVLKYFDILHKVRLIMSHLLYLHEPQLTKSFLDWFDYFG